VLPGAKAVREIRLRSTARRLQWVPPCLVGVAGFLLVVGPRVLDPTNVAWVRDRGDTLTHYLGWAFFRRAPWTIPVGLNPNYGLELSSSILYTDSIPLLALLFKPLSPWLPEPFQYTGAWLLACFVLQGLFAWRLVGLATASQGSRLAGSALFVFAPAMLFRLGGHWALAGQWIVLAALFLALRPGRHRQTARWALLAVVAALVHAYLLAMTAAIWAGAWVGDAWCRRRPLRRLGLELGVVPGAAVLALWQAGMFAVGEGKGHGGFGYYRANLLTLVNPAGWSHVLPDVPLSRGEVEGGAFLGLGALLAGVVALHAARRLRATGQLTLRCEWLPVGLAVVALGVLAASNRVAFGPYEFVYPVPAWFESAVGVVRASGRMVWPVSYLVMLGIVALIARAYPARTGAVMLAAAAVVQVADTAHGWTHLKGQLRKRAAPRSPLISGFWFEAPSMYRRVRLVPPGNLMDNWELIAGYAEQHGLATDAVYSARIDVERARALSEETAARLADGTFDRQTFFILQGGTARRVPCSIDPDRDQVAWVDGFWVLMPDWRTRHGDKYAGQLRLECPVLRAGAAPLPVVAGHASVAALARGWSMPEAWGTWSDGSWSLLTLRLGGRAAQVELTLSPVPHPGPPLQVRVSVDGQPAAHWEVADPEPWPYRVALPAAVDAAEGERPVRLRLDYSRTWSPQALGQSDDTRQLAVALRQVRVIDESDPRRR
jgi:hypothetical protein